jgi:hypothetical protein
MLSAISSEGFGIAFFVAGRDDDGYGVDVGG